MKLNRLTTNTKAERIVVPRNELREGDVVLFNIAEVGVVINGRVVDVNGKPRNCKACTRIGRVDGQLADEVIKWAITCVRSAIRQHKRAVQRDEQRRSWLRLPPVTQRPGHVYRVIIGSQLSDVAYLGTVRVLIKEVKRGRTSVQRMTGHAYLSMDLTAAGITLGRCVDIHGTRHVFADSLSVLANPRRAIADHGPATWLDLTEAQTTGASWTTTMLLNGQVSVSTTRRPGSLGSPRPRPRWNENEKGNAMRSKDQHAQHAATGGRR